ncbi:MAG: hypothetical protein HOD60_01545 [Candidatus Nitrosopelagicus sp.]|jgi:transposase-like protein|nr:hypothetical protein [Candidatus Nitrosopelagicus sp.]
MAQVSKDPLDVSSEFIESSKLSKTKSKKRGGPYSKDEKVKRLNEVNRLHFDYGYSARKISELMKINRNTINSDIDHLCSKIITDSNLTDPEISVVFNIERLNIHRSRLRASLDKAENFQQRHAIEKMIFDIESKIINTHMKLGNSMKRIYQKNIEYLNDWLEKNGKDARFLTYFDKISVSEKAHQKISKIIQEDEKKRGI